MWRLASCSNRSQLALYIVSRQLVGNQYYRYSEYQWGTLIDTTCYKTILSNIGYIFGDIGNPKPIVCLNDDMFVWLMYFLQRQHLCYILWFYLLFTNIDGERPTILIGDRNDVQYLSIFVNILTMLGISVFLVLYSCLSTSASKGGSVDTYHMCLGAYKEFGKEGKQTHSTGCTQSYQNAHDRT